MPEADGKIFPFQTENFIKADYLEAIDYGGNDQEITYETEEFSAVCPFSGLPDFGMLSIKYIPGKKIVELKSLKYYIISYRNVGIYQEAATDRIFNDLNKCLVPKYLNIKTVYNIRGGILSTCEMDSKKIK